MRGFTAFVPALALVAGLFAASPTLAASYKSLKAKGYKTGTLTRSRSGRRGWFMSGAQRYFCPLRASLVANGGGMVSFTTSGRMIKLAGKPRPGLPKLSNLQRGRPQARHVGSCRKVR